MGNLDDKVGLITRLRKFEVNLGRPVKPDELVAFIQQFASMYEVGIPILQCLEALAKQTENARFKNVIEDIILDIQGGSSFSGALSKHPQVFSTFFVNMIIAGEKGGIIDKILERMAIHIEKMQEIRRKITGAFAYPVVVGILALIVVIFLVVFIIPVFQGVYEGLHITLPLPTRMIIFLSSLLRKFGWILALLLAGAGFLFYRYKDEKLLRDRIDRIKITMPVFGKINIKAAVARFIRTFGDMMESGITLSEAIEAGKEVSGNVIVSEVVDKMYDNINRGKTLSEALEEQKLIPPTVVQMIAAGEASGKLPLMLSKSTIALERDLDLTIRRIIVMVEPALTLILACIVGFIAISIYLPMFDIIGQISKR